MIRSYYYKVELPPDLIESMSDDEIFDLAILQIRDRQKIYHMPAQWNLKSIDRDSGLVKICYQFISQPILYV